MIQAARLRVEDWPVENDSYTAVAGRLHKVYERGRNRLDDASQDPSPELFHEWRKRVKYLWYNTRILRFVWPGPMEELADEIHDLADYLGDAHDITGLSTWLERRAPLATDAARMSFMAHLAKERDVLHKRAIEQGRRIYWETPHDLVERFGTYWNTTRN